MVSRTKTTPFNNRQQGDDMFQDIGKAVEVVGAIPASGAGAGGSEEHYTPALDELQVVDNIESLCMNCEEQGITRLLLTRIPYFREIVLMSFECPHCHWRNTEIQTAGMIQEKGAIYNFQVRSREDLNRQIIKSDTCTAYIPELSLEIPAQRGHLTTIEGLLNTVLDDLASDQPARKYLDPEAFEKIEHFIENVRKLMEGERLNFTVKIDDPAGNSWIELSPDDPRGKWTLKQYLRTPEQNAALGLTNPEQGMEKPEDHGKQNEGRENKRVEEDSPIQPDEVHNFPATCPSCTRPCVTRMKFVNIPHFKEVVIMSTVCDDCGYKSNEVKTGGAIPSKGRRITLKVEGEEDLARDVLKSETCILNCPELKLDLTPGTLGGRFTTLEGLISQVHDELYDRIFSQTHDSMDPETRDRWVEFFEGLQEAKAGTRKFTVILEDPLAMSYLQNLYAPDPDPNMTIEDFERTPEQDEDLGIADMKVEGYESGGVLKWRAAQVEGYENSTDGNMTAEDAGLIRVNQNSSQGCDITNGLTNGKKG